MWEEKVGTLAAVIHRVVPASVKVTIRVVERVLFQAVGTVHAAGGGQAVFDYLRERET